jgi:hypothetical protein
VFIIPRAKGESIVIGDDLIVTVIEVEDDEVRLSVESISGQGVASRGADELAAAVVCSKKLPR